MRKAQIDDSLGLPRALTSPRLFYSQLRSHVNNFHTCYVYIQILHLCNGD